MGRFSAGAGNKKAPVWFRGRMGVRSGYPSPAHAHLAYNKYKADFHCSHPLLQRGGKLSLSKAEVNGENASDCAKQCGFFSFIAQTLFGWAICKVSLQN